MFPELERLEIPIILYILYVPYILKGTEHVVREKNIKIVVEKINNDYFTVFLEDYSRTNLKILNI